MTFVARDGFAPYKDIAVKVEYLELLDSFKFIGLVNEGLGPFENIGAFTEKYQSLVKNAVHNVTAFGMYMNLPDDSKWDYYFGFLYTAEGVNPLIRRISEKRACLIHG